MENLRIPKRSVRWLARLYGPDKLSRKELALEEGVGEKAISNRIRRLEKHLGTMLARYDRRGRKPRPVTTSA